MLQLVYILVLLVSTNAYLEEHINIEKIATNIAVSDNCTVYSGLNGTVLLKHDNTQLISVTNMEKSENVMTTFNTDIFSNIMVVNSACDLVVFGFPTDNRVALWRPDTNNITYVIPEDIQNNVFSQTYNATGLDNVRRIPISNAVDRFGFSLDIQGQTWVVGAPGTPTDIQGNGGTMGYAFVFEGNELHSCRSIYEMSCYPEEEGCVSGIDNFKNYYGKLKSPWASAQIPAYSTVDWKAKWSTSKVLDNSDVVKVQKLCLPLEVPWYKTLGRMEQKVYDEKREVFQQFGYAVTLTGELNKLGSALYISAPGNTNRFMEDNDGANYGRVYVWDNVLWPYDNKQLAWWQPSVFTPLKLPLEIATYQAFGREMAASSHTLAISVYPLYFDTSNPFIILYTCQTSGDDGLSNCQESGGISIDDIRGNPLDYLTSSDMTYLDGKTGTYVAAPEFQNNYIGKNIGVVGSNVIVADPANNKVYRFDNEGEWREQHTVATANKEAQVSFATNSKHWIAENGKSENGHTKLTHYWPCALGHTGAKHLCAAAQHAYYSDDGWESNSYPCPRNFTTTEKGRWFCDPWSAPIVPGPTWTDTVFIMIILVSTSVLCLILLALCQFSGKHKYQSVPGHPEKSESSLYPIGF